MSNRKLIQNAIRTHDGVIINSRTVHDYQIYNGYMVDGGLTYSRYSYPEEYKNEIEFLFLYEDDDFNKKKESVIWGTYGKSGKEKLKWVKLIDCDTNHLENINKINIPELYKEIIKSIIYDRYVIFRIKKIKKLLKNIKDV